MKLIILLTILLFISLQAYTQLAIINDPDGYTNVREGKSLSSKVVGQLYNDDIFMVFYDQPGDEWYSVSVTTKNSNIQGYVNKTMIIEHERLTQVPNSAENRKFENQTLAISNDSIEFTISLKAFIEKHHQVKRDENGFVQKIDGAIPRGVDGGLPKIEIASLTLKIKGESVLIPKEAYKDLFEVDLKCMNLYFDNRGNLYIYFPCNSDGAGGYSATWVIKDGRYKTRYVDAP